MPECDKKAIILAIFITGCDWFWEKKSGAGIYLCILSIFCVKLVYSQTFL